VGGDVLFVEVGFGGDAADDVAGTADRQPLAAAVEQQRRAGAGLPAAADLGYLGVDGIAIVPFRTPPGGRLHDSQAAFNKDLSGIRAAVERAVASVKTWRMLSEEGGRYRAPISKYGEMLAAVTGLFFFSNYYDPYE
jgi:DDE superfamily endonuclease